jgi:hypothetical protein
MVCSIFCSLWLNVHHRFSILDGLGNGEGRHVEIVRLDYIKTVGDLRELIKNLDDNFSVQLAVKRKLTDKELEGILFTTHDTEYVTLEFDDIGYSDRLLCLSCEIGLHNQH